MGILNGLGDSQQLIGAQMLLRNGMGNGNGTRKRKTRAGKKKRVSAAAPRARAKRGGKVKLRKGSPEAKAFMARLRKMRKR